MIRILELPKVEDEGEPGVVPEPAYWAEEVLYISDVSTVWWSSSVRLRRLFFMRVVHRLMHVATGDGDGPDIVRGLGAWRTQPM